MRKSKFVLSKYKHQIYFFYKCDIKYSLKTMKNGMVTRVGAKQTHEM